MVVIELVIRRIIIIIYIISFKIFFKLNEIKIYLHTNNYRVHYIGKDSIKGFLPIIKPPSICSFSVSSVQPVLSDISKVTSVIEISMSIDNRFVENMLGSQFLQHLKKTLETPSILTSL